MNVLTSRLVYIRIHRVSLELGSDRVRVQRNICPSADLSTVYNLYVAGQRPAIGKFIFETLSRDITAPIDTSKPVALFTRWSCY